MSMRTEKKHVLVKNCSPSTVLWKMRNLVVLIQCYGMFVKRRRKRHNKDIQVYEQGACLDRVGTPREKTSSALFFIYLLLKDTQSCTNSSLWNFCNMEIINA